uniref:Uncharacterized protein n=1 Tax=Chinchilla lanigera TaxID=34839 RepID=A0A8C2UIU0_CHILA
AEEFVSVPLKFFPIGPGHYPCKILLISSYDVRVYCVEGVVNEDQPEAALTFETPAFEPLIQNIPLHNETKKEWKCQVKIEAKWFYGPAILHIRPGETVQYPLTFKPISECEIMGKLTVKNEVDSMEHIINIKGIGKKPLAFGTITVDCKVGDVASKTIIVPNYSMTILTFKVSSDLPIVSGDPHITVDPDSSVSYVINVCPLKRGILKDEDLKNLRVWYHLEIHASAGPPLNITEVKCMALETSCIEIPISNPKEETLHIDVILTSPALSGLQQLKLSPLESVSYIVWYSPATIGYKEERYGVSVALYSILLLIF